MSAKFAALVAGLALMLASAPRPMAHEGHDHDAAPPALAHVSPRAEAQSAVFELVAAPRNGELEIWLDRFDTNAPVEGASISVETPAGSVEAKPRGGGLYGVPAPWSSKSGRYDLIFTAMAGKDMDVLSATLVIPEAAEAAAARPGVTADGLVFAPKSSQHLLAMRSQIGEAGAHGRTIEMPGRVIPDPNASGIVAAATAGRLSAPPGGFPHPGQQVQKGEVLAYVTVPFLAIDQSTLRQTEGDLDQQISIVERRLARQLSLIKTQVVAQATLDDTRLELEGLQQRRAAVDRVRREPEPLVAPVDGVIASANATAGQIADANAAIFQIVDPQRLWVEALAFDTKVWGAKAWARTDGKSFALDLIGSGLADRNQAAPVDFALHAGEGLRLGQFVTVAATTGESRNGVAAPRASVIRRGNGQNVVFEHVGAELFMAREVRVEPLDGDNLLVVAGLEPGKRIVTQGAALLDQVR